MKKALNGSRLKTWWLLTCWTLNTEWVRLYAEIPVKKPSQHWPASPVEGLGWDC